MTGGVPIAPSGGPATAPQCDTNRADFVATSRDNRSRGDGVTASVSLGLLWQSLLPLQHPSESRIMLRQFEHSFRGVFIGHQQGGSPVLPRLLPQFPCIHPLGTGHKLYLFSERLFLTARSGLSVPREVRMPDAWNAAIYRERAAAWRNKATTLPDDSRERDICGMIARGYDDLADLIEQRERLSSQPPQMRPP